jgi:hypothetical protein
MTELFIGKDLDLYSLTSIVSGYYVEETPKTIRIQLMNGQSFWVPKRYINSAYSSDSSKSQNFIIENWILRKIGFKL